MRSTLRATVLSIAHTIAMQSDLGVSETQLKNCLLRTAPYKVLGGDVRSGGDVLEHNFNGAVYGSALNN